MTLPTPNSAIEKKLADDLGRGGDLRAEVIDQQSPRDQPQQKQQQAGAQGVGHI